MSRKKIGKLLERARRGDLALDNPDDQRRFALWESFREYLRHGATSKRGIFLDAIECVELMEEVDQIDLPASRRGRNSPIGPKQHVAYLADLAKRDYLKQNRRKRVSRQINYRIYERAIELMEGRFPQWRSQVILEPGLPGATDIRRYNWRRSEEMESAGESAFPDARKLMRRAWEW